MEPTASPDIIELAEPRELIEVVAEQLRAGFAGHSPAWRDHPSALQEVLASLAGHKISRIMLGSDEEPARWIAAEPVYAGKFTRS